MQHIVFALDDRLANVGDTVSLTGHVDDTVFELSDRTLDLPQGMDYDLVLTNAGEGVLATGIVRARAETSCDRCLDPAVIDVAGEVDEYYLFSEPDEGVAQKDEEEGPDYALVGADATLDLTDAISSAFVMEIPYVVLCDVDCKGLCPICGENLNHADCGHGARIEREREEMRMEQSPFAVLRNLDVSE